MEGAGFEVWLSGLPECTPGLKLPIIRITWLCNPCSRHFIEPLFLLSPHFLEKSSQKSNRQLKITDPHDGGGCFVFSILLFSPY